jgi:phospholipid transport system substrate-binding protein
MIVFRRRTSLWLVLVIFLLPALTRAAEPMKQIRESIDKTLAVLKDPALKGPDKLLERRKKMREVADERFDWPTMAQLAMGKNWPKLTPAQKEEFTTVFSDLVERSYMSKIDGYSGEKLVYKGEKIDEKNAYATVDVNILTLRGTEVPVTYRVQNEENKWLVYDFSVEGISFVNNYRSQINSILNNGTYDELIKKIRAKIAELVADEEARNAKIPNP